MLDTRFPRIPGDVGNAGTWPFPVLFRVVRGASPEHVVQRRAEGLLDAFVDAAHELVADGADGITTNCGFLALYQRELAAAVGVPVAASSLMQVPMVEALLPPGRRAGVVTISAASLTAEHLRCAGAAADTPVVGTEEDGKEFSRAIIGDELELDVEQARADLLRSTARLLDAHPEVGALVLECTNMIPYAADLREAHGLPVYSLYSFVQWFHAGLLPRAFHSGLHDPRPAAGDGA
jgi:Asp/Glu/hydantoin racemase